MNNISRILCQNLRRCEYFPLYIFKTLKLKFFKITGIIKFCCFLNFQLQISRFFLCRKWTLLKSSQYLKKKLTNNF